MIAYFSREVSDKPIDAITAFYSTKKYDESIYASKIAQDSNLNSHTKVLIREEEAFEAFDELTASLTYCLDPASLPLYILSKSIKGLSSVALTGDGADPSPAFPRVNPFGNALAQVLAVGNQRYRRITAGGFQAFDRRL